MILDLQKASMWKRISAFLFDAIMITILAVLAAWGLSTLLNYDSYYSAYSSAYARYAEEYSLTDDLLSAAADPSALSSEEQERINAASAALAADGKAIHAYSMVISLQMLFLTLSLLLAFLIWEFFIPLALGNGQTLGKKIFGVGVMHVGSIRIGHVALFIRAILGKYAVETMLPIMCLFMILNGMANAAALLVVAVLLIAQVCVLAASHENAMLHDKMAATVTVDIASQMIFNTRDDLIAYQKRLAAEEAAAVDA